MRITVPATWTATPQQMERVIGAVLPHTSPAHELPMLNSVRLELDGDRLLTVASDRYSLAVCRASLKEWDKEAKPVKDTTASVRVDDVKRLLAFLRPQRKFAATWKLTAATLTVSFAGGPSLTVRTADGENFPEWRAIFVDTAARKPEPGARMGFTPRVVEHFHRSAKVLGEPTETWHFVSPLKPVIVRVGEDFLGLLMPCSLPDAAPALDLAAFGIETAKAGAA
jgi:hypothetical protein